MKSTMILYKRNPKTLFLDFYSIFVWRDSSTQAETRNPIAGNQKDAFLARNVQKMGHFCKVKIYSSSTL